MKNIDHLLTRKIAEYSQSMPDPLGNNIIKISIPRTSQQPLPNLKIIHINNILMTYFPLPKDRCLLLLICVDHLICISLCL